MLSILNLHEGQYTTTAVGHLCNTLLFQTASKSFFPFQRSHYKISTKQTNVFMF